jgi:hypothetical protein
MNSLSVVRCLGHASLPFPPSYEQVKAAHSPTPYPYVLLSVRSPHHFSLLLGFFPTSLPANKVPNLSCGLLCPSTSLFCCLQVGNRASEFHPEIRRVRRDGSYLYEEFMPTGGTDVKVYTVGPDYAHAEARKSPVVDGVVQRSKDGKEVRCS